MTVLSPDASAVLVPRRLAFGALLAMGACVLGVFTEAPASVDPSDTLFGLFWFPFVGNYQWITFAVLRLLVLMHYWLAAAAVLVLRTATVPPAHRARCHLLAMFMIIPIVLVLAESVHAFIESGARKEELPIACIQEMIHAALAVAGGAFLLTITRLKRRHGLWHLPGPAMLLAAPIFLVVLVVRSWNLTSHMTTGSPGDYETIIELFGPAIFALMCLWLLAAWTITCAAALLALRRERSSLVVAA